MSNRADCKTRRHIDGWVCSLNISFRTVFACVRLILSFSTDLQFLNCNCNRNTGMTVFIYR